MNHVRRFMWAAAILLLLVSSAHPVRQARSAPLSSAFASPLDDCTQWPSILPGSPITTRDEFNVRHNSVNNTVRVLDNDYDPDGDPLTIIGVFGSTERGTMTISGTVLIYTPKPNTWGVHEFYYTVSDGRGGIACGDVTIYIYGRPAMPSNDYYRVLRNSGPQMLDIMSNDSSGENDHRIQIGAIAPPRHGSAAIAYGEYGAIGAIYTPTADFSGADHFTYTLRENPDGVAQVGITVADAGENGSPIALDDTFQVIINSAATNLAVLVNDRDLDDEAFEMTAIGPARHGTLASLGSSVAYTPTADFAGTDSFTYTISDAGGLSATALVNLTVGPPPTLWPGFRQLPGSLPVAGQYYSATLVADDGDADDMLMFSSGELPAGLSLIDHGDRTATLLGTPTQAGAYTPTLSISDPHMTTSVALPLSVRAAPLTITSPPPAPAIYGGAYSHTLVAVGPDPTSSITFTVTSGALPPGLNLELDGVLSGIPVAVGSYPAIGLTASSADGSATQLITLTVAPAPLTITANAVARPLAQPNPPLTAQFSGFVLGEDASVLSSPLVLSTPATPASPPGSYAITPSGAAATNYAITFVPGVLTVTRAKLFLPLVARP